MKYNAFISYSHEADNKFAPALQTALQKFAKPWYKKRNLEIFRDESSLSASPHLWDNITKALDQSEYLILLASPQSEKSEWVNKEVEYWLEHKPKDKAVKTILIALTEGEMIWDNANNCYQNPDNNSLPPVLDDKFKLEPFYIDLRQSKTEEDLSLNNPIFNKEVLKVAAKLHNKTPNDLASEEVTTHRKMMVLRNTIFISLCFLLIATFIFYKRAESNRKEAEANYLNSEVNRQKYEDPTLALRLAENAMKINNSDDPYRDALKIYRENNFYNIVSKETNFIQSVAFSPDGQNILTGSLENDAHLWDLNGKLIQIFKGHTGPISSVAFSSQGDKILTASQDSTARLWKLNGESIQEFVGHSAAVRSAVFSPDGTKILTGSDDATARLWDLNGNEIWPSSSLENLLPFYISHSGQIMSVAFSPEGDKILIGTLFNEVYLWELNGQWMRKIGSHSNAIWDVSFSPDGKKILVGSSEKIASLWDLNGNLIRKFEGHTDNVTSVTFSREGDSILTGSIDRTARLWNLKGELLQEFKGHTAPISSVAFAPIGNFILTGSHDMTSRLWELKKDLLQEFSGHNDFISSLAFSRDGATILTGSRDRTARLWDLEGNLLQKYEGHNGWVISAAFSQDGKNIITGSLDNTAKIWDLNGDVIKEFKVTKDSISAMAFSPDRKTILTGHSDLTARLWDWNGGLIREFANHEGVVRGVAFATEGNKILTVSETSVRLWDIGGELKQGITHYHSMPIEFAIFSPDGNSILTCSYDGIVNLWDLNTDDVREIINSNDPVTSLAFSPNGNSILIGSLSYTRLRDLNGNILQEFMGHNEAIFAVAFSTNGTIISGSGDGNTGKGTARLYQVVKPMEDFLKNNKIAPLSSAQKLKYKIKNN
ncbi:eIF2A-related protein [Muriicola sp. Z0-33]|uniref:WD40 domain-containing protein n=1 Tax=Muriicola sp. Z0-33 TaxID=2816957 RepID=UPI002236FB2D|nr:TIR domain-containing protein [Muriicola sp. Z0-33]MCW5516167.1 TIR domain-containing protein [Muriicola sp. Z0-33]